MFYKGFFILKWKYWADIINSPIRTDGIRTNDGYQIPATSNVDNEILAAPTKLRVKSLNPNCVNSFTTLPNLKIQTYATDIATIICNKFMKFSIYFLIYFLLLWFSEFARFLKRVPDSSLNILIQLYRFLNLNP